MKTEWKQAWYPKNDPYLLIDYVMQTNMSFKQLPEMLNRTWLFLGRFYSKTLIQNITFEYFPTVLLITVLSLKKTLYDCIVCHIQYTILVYCLYHVLYFPPLTSTKDKNNLLNITLTLLAFRMSTHLTNTTITEYFSKTIH